MSRIGKYRPFPEGRDVKAHGVFGLVMLLLRYTAILLAIASMGETYERWAGEHLMILRDGLKMNLFVDNPCIISCG